MASTNLTAGQLVSKISEFRSKIAVLESLVLHLRTNYLSTEGRAEDDIIPPEFYVTREDGSRVSETHVQASIEDVLTQISTLREEVAAWEAIPMEGPKTKKRKKEQEDEDVVVE
jgi:uncharacterized protein YlzI (FlbEa/FlbD family)